MGRERVKLYGVMLATCRESGASQVAGTLRRAVAHGGSLQIGRSRLTS
jgi:hypothetical protein